MTPTRGLFVAAGVVAACILWKFGHHWSATGVVLGHDWFTMHLIDALYVERAATEGHLATWAPHVLGGTQLFGVATKPMTYPPFLAAVAGLGATLGMNVLLFVHALLAGVGTWALARRLGLRGPAPIACAALLILAQRPGDSFVGIPFGTGYAMAWWPWTLICVLDLLENRARRWTAPALGTLVALQWHAGGEPTLIWLACFCAAFAIPYLLRRRSRTELSALALGALIAALTCLGLVAVRLLPELVWIEASGRGAPMAMEALRDELIEEELAASGQSSRLWVFTRLLANQTWWRGGLLVAALALLGAVRGGGGRAWIGLALGTTTCLLIASGALHELAYDYLPGYSRMRGHTRFVDLFGYGSILLAGYGLQHLWPRSTRPQVAAALLIALAVLLGTGQLRPTSKRLGDPEEHRAAIARELAPVLADPALGRFHHQAHREQASWVALDVESTGGALGGPASGNARFHELLPEHTRPALLESRVPHVLDVLNVRYVASYAPLEHAHLEPLPRLGRSARERAQLKELGLGPIRLSRRTTARPRVALVEQPTLVVGPPARRRNEVTARLRRAEAGWPEVLVESIEANLDALDPTGFGTVLFPGLRQSNAALKRWAEAHPEGELTYELDTSTWKRPGKTRLTPVDDTRFTKDLRSITVDVTGLGPGFLLLAETAALYPGWRATLDGREVTLALADGLVTLVQLPEGASRLELAYTPPGLRLGAWITGGTIALLALLLVLGVRHRTGTPAA